MAETDRLCARIDDLAARQAAADERLRGQVVTSRRYLHQIRGELQAVTGTLEMIRAEGDLPTPHQQEITEAVERLATISELAEQLHALVRRMAPT